MIGAKEKGGTAAGGKDMKKKTWLLIPAVLLLLLAAAMLLLHRVGAQPVESKPAGSETITQTTTTIHPTTLGMLQLWAA